MNKKLFFTGLLIISAGLCAERIPSLIFSDNKAFLRNIAVQLQKLNQAFEQHGLGVVVHNHGNGITPVNTASMNIVQEGSTFAVAPETGLPAHFDELRTGGGWWGYITSFFGSSKPKGPQKPTLTGYLWSNKRELVTKAAVVGYLYSNYQLVSLGSFLQGVERWSNWQHHMNLAALLDVEQQVMRKDLFAEVEKRYGTTQAREKFLADVETEIAALNKYLKLVNMLATADMLKNRCFAACSAWMPKFFGISLGFGLNMLAGQVQVKSVFFVDETLFKSAQERLARLMYLKNVCLAQPLKLKLSF